MAFYNTYVTYSGNGTTTDFSVPFSYLAQSEVVAVFTGTGTYTYTFPSSNILRVSPALASGDTLKVSRVTSLTSSKVVFSNGAPITGTQLNTTVNQLIYGLQEASDTSAAVYTIAAAATASVAAATSAATAATNAANAAVLAAANATAGVVGDGTILTVKLADNSVTTAKIADSNVTTAKIADSNVTTAKIADGAVTSAKLGITPGAVGNILTSNGTTWASTAPAVATPTGTTVIFGSSTTPSGYLKCDGSVYATASYSTLQAVLGSIPVSYPENVNSINQAPHLVNGNLVHIPVDGKYYVSTNQGASFTTVTIPATSYWYMPRGDNSPTYTGYSTIPYSGFYVGQMVWTGTYYVALAAVWGACCGVYYQTPATGIVYSSSLGTTWTNVTTNISFQGSGLASNGSGTVVMFAGATANNVNWMSYSTNHGVTWTGATGNAVGGTQIGWRSVVWSPSANLFVAAGWQSSTTNARIITSPNGITWTSRTVPSQLSGNRIAFLSSTTAGLVAIDNVGNIASSTDGITWTYKSTKLGFTNVTYLASTGTYYANGYASFDLISWWVAPTRPGSLKWTSDFMVTDGTRLYGTSSIYNPYPYTTASQFAVPDYGSVGNGPAPVLGQYYYIKT